MPCVYRSFIHFLPPLINKPYSLPVFIEYAASFAIYIILPESLPTHKCFGVVKERRNKTGHQSQNFFLDSPPNAKSFTISWVSRISVRYFPPYVGFWKVVVACLKIGFSPCNENAASLRNPATLRTTEQNSIRFNGQISTYGV